LIFANQCEYVFAAGVEPALAYLFIDKAFEGIRQGDIHGAHFCASLSRFAKYLSAAVIAGALKITGISPAATVQLQSRAYPGCAVMNCAPNTYESPAKDKNRLRLAAWPFSS
jgi:hypothetical protein